VCLKSYGFALYDHLKEVKVSYGDCFKEVIFPMKNALI